MTLDELFAIGDTLFDFLLLRGLDKEHRASRTTGWRFAFQAAACWSLVDVRSGPRRLTAQASSWSRG
jgi:hypothetical protein